MPQSHYIVGNKGCNYGSEQEGSEKVYVMNLRNLIIQGRMYDQRKQNNQRYTAYFVCALLPLYLVLCCCCCMMKDKSADKLGDQSHQKKRDEGRKEDIKVSK